MKLRNRVVTDVYDKTMPGYIEIKGQTPKNQVRLLLEGMARYGAVLKPIGLAQAFYGALKWKYPIQKGQQNRHIEKARNMAEVYSILCNEFFKAQTIFKIDKAFFVTQDAWNQHMIVRKIKETSVALLEELGYIKTYNYWFGYEKNKRRKMYIINVKKLNYMRNEVRSIPNRAERKLPKVSDLFPDMPPETMKAFYEEFLTWGDDEENYSTIGNEEDYPDSIFGDDDEYPTTLI